MSDIFLVGGASVEIDQDLSLDRNQVEGCVDGALLAAWFLAVGDKLDEIRAFADGYREVEYGDDDWRKRAGGKLGYLKLMARWIERRILNLGLEPPYHPTDPRARYIRNLERKLARLETELEATRAGKVALPAAAEPAQ